MNTQTSENPIETTRPDSLTVAEIQKLFEPFGDAYERILRREHTVILGPRDSGKSMVLKYMSLPTQLIEHRSLSNLPFIGIYLPLSAGICNPFIEAYRSDKSKRWEMFSHCFNLLFSEVLVGTVKDLKEIGDSLKKEIIGIIKDTFSFLYGIDEPDRIVKTLQDERRRISDKIELSKPRSLSSDGFNEVTFIHSFIPFICQRLNEIFSRAAGKEVKVYLLIDGYENLEELAPVFNVLIERYGDQPYFLKMGARRFGGMIEADIRNRSIEPHQDFHIVSLIYESPASESYMDWVRSIINGHFRKSGKEKFRNLDIFSLLSPGLTQEMLLPSVDYKELKLPSFRQLGREARQGNYYGFLTFVLLSSGTVGDFVQLCHAVMDKRITQGDQLNRRSLADVAKEFSNKEFLHILERGRKYGSELQRLIYHILSPFEEQFVGQSGTTSTEAIPYKVKILMGNPEEVNNTEFCTALKQGFEIGVLRSDKIVEHEVKNTVPLEFWVNLSLMPKFGLKPVIGGGEEGYPMSILQEIMKKRYPEEPGAPLRFTDRIKPKAPKKKVFLSTSFQVEDKLARDALKIGMSEHILDRRLSQRDFEVMEPKYCFDAEDIRGPEKLRDRAKYGLTIADYSIFDVSSRRPSVFFELGMAHALCKPWWMVWHCTSSNPLDTSFLPGFLKQPLIIDFTLTKAGRLSKRDEFCRKVLGSLRELEKGEQFPPDPLAELRQEVALQSNTFYLAHSGESYWSPTGKEVKSWLEGRGLTEVSSPGNLIGEDEGIKICYCIRSASLCLIDTTGLDCGFHYMLGYAYAQKEKRIVISLHRDDKEPIFMWEGMPDIPWNMQRISQNIITHLEAYIPKKGREKP